MFPGGGIRGFPAAGAGGPQRTFVSTGGADPNPCSLVAPCREFTAAVAAVANDGEVIALDSGGYGSFTITKSTTVVAPPGAYAGISVFAGTDGGVVTEPFVSPTLKGLTINVQGGNSGIDFVQGARLTVESCEIANVGANFSAAILARGDNTVHDNNGGGAQTNGAIGSLTPL